MFGYLLQGVALGISAAASPGPFQAFLLSQTMRNGWRRTLPAALAPLFSDGPIVALALLALTQMPDGFLRVVRVAGGAFILYLALGAYRAARQPVTLVDAPLDSGPQTLTKAIVMNALNPNPYLFWGIVAGPIVLEGWRRSASLAVSFVGGFYGALVSGTALLVILFATARRLGPRVRRALNGVSALALFLFGLYQLWQGVMG
ncbi:MAG TPA: LysE family transporter [Caldilineae bacterium]|nr:LysE family transporter [Caldilineae bacterium]